MSFEEVYKTFVTLCVISLCKGKQNNKLNTLEMTNPVVVALAAAYSTPSKPQPIKMHLIKNPLDTTQHAHALHNARLYTHIQVIHSTSKDSMSHKPMVNICTHHRSGQYCPQGSQGLHGIISG